MKVIILEDVLIEYEGMTESEALIYLNRKRKKYGKSLKRIVCQADNDKYAWITCTLKQKVKSHVRRKPKAKVQK